MFLFSDIFFYQPRLGCMLVWMKLVGRSIIINPLYLFWKEERSLQVVRVKGEEDGVE